MHKKKCENKKRRFARKILISISRSCNKNVIKKLSKSFCLKIKELTHACSAAYY
jgi:hypothetical protein